MVDEFDVEVTPRLAHPHQSSCEKRGLQVGYTPSSSLARATIPLYRPGTRQFKEALPDYLNLTQGMKLEGYRGRNTGPGATPDYSYVIDDVSRDTEGWSIAALSTMVWLQKSYMVPGEILASPITGVLPTHGDEIVQALAAPLQRIWQDDFSGYAGGSGPHPASDYTVSADWSWTAADPYRGRPALTSTNTGAESFVITNTTWPNVGQFWVGVIRITGTVRPGTAASPNNSGDMSIIFLGNTAWTAGVLTRAGVIYNGSTWDVSVDLNSKAGAVYTGRGSAANVLQGVRSPFPFQITVPIFMNAGRHTSGCWVNGKDSGMYVIDGGWYPASGGIGVRYVPTAGGSPQIWLNRLEFFARPVDGIWGTQRFDPSRSFSGLSPTGSYIPQEIATQGQDQLSMIQMAAATDGMAFRLHPGRGAFGDAYNYDFPVPNNTTATLTAARDLSGKLVLREGVNVKKATVSASEPFGSDIRMQAIPNTDTGGTISYSAVKQEGSMVQEANVADVGQPAFRFLTDWAAEVQSRHANPFGALVLVVMRTPEVAGWNLDVGDVVMVDAPGSQWFMTPATIVSIQESETSDEMTIACNVFSRSVQSADRMANWVSAIGRTFRTR